MAMPTDIGVVDTLIGIPNSDRRSWYGHFESMLRDEGSKTFEHPAGYMYKETPKVRRTSESVVDLLREMDRFGIERGLLAVDLADEMVVAALQEHPDRLSGSLMVDPNRGMAAVRDLERAVAELGVVAAQYMPAGVVPPVAINDKMAYPLYAKCVELDIAIFVNGGVPGPRVPMMSQYPGHVDEVCWFFPELKFVFRHCCEPWVDLTVKLLLKWENLYYSTTAFAPKYYPRAIVDFANTRGADKIIYGGYYPYGLELERIFAELPELGLKDDVWPKFLRENALRVLKLPG
ncbi:MAG: Amidohydrolase [Streptosporangiaceae bacterium]|nr:Amidohydrolase [Streptosporangiaceae bacterium]